MKSIIAFTIVMLGLAVQPALAAKKTESFKVSGVCGMCKNRIEKAAKAAGATEASWNEDEQMLTVNFNDKKASLEQIRKQIAAVGHDNGDYKASTEVYNNLPECCHYDRSGKKTEHKHH